MSKAIYKELKVKPFVKASIMQSMDEDSVFFFFFDNGISIGVDFQFLEYHHLKRVYMIWW